MEYFMKNVNGILMDYWPVFAIVILGYTCLLLAGGIGKEIGRMLAILRGGK